jgi:hypothetical protein
MSIATTVADVIGRHVKFEVESIDRMYLNVYQQMLQRGGGVSVFFRRHRGEACATALVMSRMTRAFVQSVETFSDQHGVPIIPFEKGIRKEDVFHHYLEQFKDDQGVVMIGKAQEQATVYRTIKRRCETTGKTYPWLMKSTAMVNHYYFYCVDREFGPFFIKFCSYFPYNAKLCINGHEYAKRQLANRGIAFQASDNAILECDDVKALQRIADGLSAAKIDALLRRWLARLPHPFTRADRRAGFVYRLSMLQAEFALTQVLDRPLSGRIFFERVIRDNIDLGRPKNVQLIFDRRIQKNTPSRFRTRVMTQGVVPSLWVDYKSSTIKQYFKQGRAIRTETTVNNTRDFGIGRKIENLTALRKMACAANRRLLHVQQLDHDPALGQDEFDELTQPTTVDGQRASGLKFADPVVLAVLSALLIFRLLPRGFSNRELRDHVAQLLVCSPGEFTPGRMSYHLRRLRLKGLITRIGRTQRYEVTDAGLRAALFYIGSHSRLIRPFSQALHQENELQQQILQRIQPLVPQAAA